MVTFTRIIRLALFVYGTCTVLRFSRINTDTDSENKESMAFCDEGICEALRSRSSSMDTELFRAISPLNTPPTNAASETQLHDSVKVQVALDMEAKSTANGAEELELGARRKIPTDKCKQYVTIRTAIFTKEMDKTKSAKGRIADFEEFSQFVREQAELATDPVFSEKSVSKPREDGKGKGTQLKFGRRSVNKRKETILATGLN